MVTFNINLFTRIAWFLLLFDKLNILTNVELLNRRVHLILHFNWTDPTVNMYTYLIISEPWSHGQHWNKQRPLSFYSPLELTWRFLENTRSFKSTNGKTFPFSYPYKLIYFFASRAYFHLWQNKKKYRKELPFKYYEFVIQCYFP